MPPYLFVRILETFLQFVYINFLFSRKTLALGSVVQSNVSLTTSLSKSFVKCFRKYYDNISICCVAKCKALFALLQLHTVLVFQ